MRCVVYTFLAMVMAMVVSIFVVGVLEQRHWSQSLTATDHTHIELLTSRLTTAQPGDVILHRDGKISVINHLWATGGFRTDLWPDTIDHTIRDTRWVHSIVRIIRPGDAAYPRACELYVRQRFEEFAIKQIDNELLDLD